MALYPRKLFNPQAHDNYASSSRVRATRSRSGRFESSSASPAITKSKAKP